MNMEYPRLTLDMESLSLNYQDEDMSEPALVERIQEQLEELDRVADDFLERISVMRGEADRTRKAMKGIDKDELRRRYTSATMNATYNCYIALGMKKERLRDLKERRLYTWARLRLTDREILSFVEDVFTNKDEAERLSLRLEALFLWQNCVDSIRDNVIDPSSFWLVAIAELTASEMHGELVNARKLINDLKRVILSDDYIAIYYVLHSYRTGSYMGAFFK